GLEDELLQVARVAKVDVFIVGHFDVLTQIVEHHDPSERRRKGRDEKSVIAPRRNPTHRSGRVAAEAVRHEPFAIGDLLAGRPDQTRDVGWSHDASSGPKRNAACPGTIQRSPASATPPVPPYAGSSLDHRSFHLPATRGSAIDRRSSVAPRLTTRRRSPAKRMTNASGAITAPLTFSWARTTGSFLRIASKSRWSASARSSRSDRSSLQRSNVSSAPGSSSGARARLGNCARNSARPFRTSVASS